MDLSKLWIAGVGLMGGAILGAWIWAQHAAGQVAQHAGTGDDALINTAQTVGTNSVAAALQGAFVGGLIGLALGIAFLYFSDPDRGMKIRHIENDDHLQ